MERVTLRIPKQQVNEVEQLVETGEYPNRSEAIRSMIREQLKERRKQLPRSPVAEKPWRKG